MRKKQSVMHLDQRHNVMLENAFYMVSTQTDRAYASATRLSASRERPSSYLPCKPSSSICSTMSS